MRILISSLTPRGLLDTNSKRGGSLFNGIIINNYIIYNIFSNNNHNNSRSCVSEVVKNSYLYWSTF